MSFESDRDYIYKSIADGTAGDREAAFLEWIDRYEASGSPATADGVMSKAEYGHYLKTGERVELEGDEGLTQAQGGTSDQKVAAGTGYKSIFNPVTGQMDVVVDEGQWGAGKGNAIWGITGRDEQGYPIYGLIRTDVEGWEDTGGKFYNDGYFDWEWGYEDPNPDDGFYDGGLGLGGTVPPEYADAPDGSIPRPTDPFDPTGPTDGGGTVRPDIPKPPTETEIVPWNPDLSGDRPSWNWDYFAPKQAGDGQWGGYDSDYGVFERYQPGQDSPWGMPDVMGGNTEFYQQQFNNLLRDEQDYRTRQRAAQLRAQEAAENPAGAINFGDMWESMGITPTQASTGGSSNIPTEYGLNQAYNLTADMSANEMLNNIMPILNDQEQVYLNKHRDYFDNADWSSREAVQDWASSNPYQKDKGWTTVVNEIAQNIYTPTNYTQGPSVPAGYAAPIAGY